MWDKIRKVLTVILTLLLLVSLTMLGIRFWEYHKGAQSSAAAEQTAALPNFDEIATPEPVASKEPSADSDAESEEEPQTDPYLEALEALDLEALQETNPEVLGWILIPNTKVNYPIVQTSNNDYYLKHTWDNTYSSTGSIFLDYKCDPEMTAFNTIIYGHRMRDGSMFRAIANYNTQSYWEEHPYIYIADANGCRRYAIYASYEASVTGSSYEVKFASDAAKEKFIKQGTTSTVIKTGIVPTTEDHIITLSTCTGVGYSTRWIVQAVEMEPEESEETEEPEEIAEQPEEQETPKTTP
jgi:sortase B